MSGLLMNYNMLSGGVGDATQINAQFVNAAQAGLTYPTPEGAVAEYVVRVDGLREFRRDLKRLEPETAKLLRVGYQGVARARRR
jgi:hypothetical protein